MKINSTTARQKDCLEMWCISKCNSCSFRKFKFNIFNIKFLKEILCKSFLYIVERDSMNRR